MAHLRVNAPTVPVIRIALKFYRLFWIVICATFENSILIVFEFSKNVKITSL